MPERPNILLVITDMERAAPPYEGDGLRAWRQDRLPAHQRLEETGTTFERHYTASIACVPSRATLFTGQLPTLHGVPNTNGFAKAPWDPMLHWLDPQTVPTLGHWFRAAGYRTFLRGKWHISEADLVSPGGAVGLASSTDEGTMIPEVVELYRRTDRLDPWGFGGWIGREPFGVSIGDMGLHRDVITADQIVDLLDELDRAPDDRPWFAVANFLNPHDIMGWGPPWMAGGLPLPDDVAPSSPGPSPSATDPLDDRPTVHRQWVERFADVFWPVAADARYLAAYYWLTALIDRQIERVLERLAASGSADDTVVVLTADHGNAGGAHGGLQQMWYNAYDETIRVPLVMAGPGIPSGRSVAMPTGHLDLLPTLLGLAGVETAPTAKVLHDTHTEVHDLPGRDLSSLVRGDDARSGPAHPVYFMTEDHMSAGALQRNLLTGEPYEPVTGASCIETVISPLEGRPGSMWKLSHYYTHLDDWEDDTDHRSALVDRRTQFDGEPPPDEWELYDLVADPEERTNLAADPAAAEVLGLLEDVLAETRRSQRSVPRHVGR